MANPVAVFECVIPFLADELRGRVALFHFDRHGYHPALCGHTDRLAKLPAGRSVRGDGRDCGPVNRLNRSLPHNCIYTADGGESRNTLILPPVAKGSRGQCVGGVSGDCSFKGDPDFTSVVRGCGHDSLLLSFSINLPAKISRTGITSTTIRNNSRVWRFRYTI